MQSVWVLSALCGLLVALPRLLVADSPDGLVARDNSLVSLRPTSPSGESATESFGEMTSKAAQRGWHGKIKHLCLANR